MSPRAMNAEPRWKTRLTGLAVAGVLAAGGSVVAAEEVDATAMQRLRSMSEFLSRQKEFTFKADTTTQVVLKTGERVDLDHTSRIAVRRPNMLRSERTGTSSATLYYDGKAITFHGKADQAYATIPAPATLDQAIDFARDELGLEAPGADLLYRDPYRILMEDVIAATYLGKSTVRDTASHHLVFRGRETDWQIWIRDAPEPVPVRMVIVSKKVPGAPEFRVDFSQWDFSPDLDASAFRFVPPKDVRRVEFVGIAAQPQPSEAPPRPRPQAGAKQ